jgi:flagellar protein FliO/FliZ
MTQPATPQTRDCARRTVARRAYSRIATSAALAVATMLATASATAATTVTAASSTSSPIEPSFAGGLAQTIFGLAIVLALIWGAAWLLRRLNVGAPSAGSAIRVLASQAIGQRERVVLVEVADQWLVLGVAPGQVNGLATLPKGELPVRSVASSPFASLLARARNRDGNAGGDA